jgi:hypothetical protein
MLVGDPDNSRSLHYISTSAWGEVNRESAVTSADPVPPQIIAQKLSRTAS